MEVLIIVMVAVLLWSVLRSKGAPPPHTAPEVAAEGARIGCGLPLAIMVVMAFIVLALMGGTLTSGDCDVNAGTGEPGSCTDKAFDKFESLTGLRHYDSAQEWWNDRPESIR